LPLILGFSHIKRDLEHQGILMSVEKRPSPSHAKGDSTNVFNFSNYRDFIADAGQQHFRHRSERPTLANWALWLGYRSPRSIAMVLKGQRLPGQSMIEKLSQALRLDDHQHRYLELLVNLEKEKRNGGDEQPVIDELSRLSPNHVFQTNLSTQAFKNIADWYYLVIRQCVDLVGFRDSPQFIRNLLRNKIRIDQIKEAISGMLQLGVLERSPNGKLKKALGHVTTTTDKPSQAIKIHHRQMAQRAIDSLMELEVHDREFTTATFTFKNEQMEEAKTMIREFRDQFHKKFQADSGHSVAQLNVQFFKHADISQMGGK
jgi:uncharacterized protein (TIGR02147 family)